MIHASFKRNARQEIASFELTGHADFGPEGSDIVCAGVSALAFGAVNSLTALAGFAPLIEMNDDRQGGYLYVELPIELDSEQLKTAQILLESLLLSLQGIVEEYPDYARVDENK